MTVFNPKDFVLEHLAAGTAEKDIRKELEDNHGTLSAVGRRLIKEVKATNPEVMERRQQRLKAIRGKEKGSWLWTVLIGVGLCVLGIGVTAITHAIAGPGGTFFVAGGAIIIGLLTILKGIWHLIRWW